MRFQPIKPDDHETLNILENILDTLKNLAQKYDQIATFKNLPNGKIELTLEDTKLKGNKSTLHITGYLDAQTTNSTNFTIFEVVSNKMTAVFSNATTLYGIAKY